MIKNPLISANALANTNITDGSFITLNKWNSKIAHYEHLSRRLVGGHEGRRGEADLSVVAETAQGATTQSHVDRRHPSTEGSSEHTKEAFKNKQSNSASAEATESARLSEIDDKTQDEDNFPGYEPRLSLLIGSSSQETISNSAFLTAKTIQEQLEKRVPFRRAV